MLKAIKWFLIVFILAGSIASFVVFVNQGDLLHLLLGVFNLLVGVNLATDKYTPFDL